VLRGNSCTNKFCSSTPSKERGRDTNGAQSGTVCERKKGTINILLNRWSRTLLEKLVSLSAGRWIPRRLGPECLLMLSQEPATGPSPELGASSPRRHILFNIQFNIIISSRTSCTKRSLFFGVSHSYIRDAVSSCHDPYTRMCTAALGHVTLRNQLTSLVNNRVIGHWTQRTDVSSLGDLWCHVDHFQSCQLVLIDKMVQWYKRMVISGELWRD
jgi:hypothetical protein